MKYNDIEFDDFITANEARLKTEENIKNSAIDTLLEIKEKIYQAINDKDFYILHNGTIQNEVFNKLIKLGYKIEPLETNVGDYNKISW